MTAMLPDSATTSSVVSDRAAFTSRSTSALVTVRSEMPRIRRVAVRFSRHIHSRIAAIADVRALPAVRVVVFVVITMIVICAL